jgi:hypothetical protein
MNDPADLPKKGLDHSDPTIARHIDIPPLRLAKSLEQRRAAG